MKLSLRLETIRVNRVPLSVLILVWGLLLSASLVWARNRRAEYAAEHPTSIGHADYRDKDKNIDFVTFSSPLDLDRGKGTYRNDQGDRSEVWVYNEETNGIENFVIVQEWGTKEELLTIIQKVPNSTKCDIFTTDRHGPLKAEGPADSCYRAGEALVVRQGNVRRYFEFNWVEDDVLGLIHPIDTPSAKES